MPLGSALLLQYPIDILGARPCSCHSEPRIFAWSGRLCDAALCGVPFGMAPGSHRLGAPFWSHIEYLTKQPESCDAGHCTEVVAWEPIVFLGSWLDSRDCDMDSFTAGIWFGTAGTRCIFRIQLGRPTEPQYPAQLCHCSRVVSALSQLWHHRYYANLVLW